VRKDQITLANPQALTGGFNLANFNEATSVVLTKKQITTTSKANKIIKTQLSGLSNI
jgi:hypothetical protein